MENDPLYVETKRFALCGKPDTPIGRNATAEDLLMETPRLCQCCHTRLEIRDGSTVRVPDIKTTWVHCPTCTSNQCPATASS